MDYLNFNSVASSGSAKLGTKGDRPSSTNPKKLSSTDTKVDPKKVTSTRAGLTSQVKPKSKIMKK